MAPQGSPPPAGLLTRQAFDALPERKRAEYLAALAEAGLHEELEALLAMGNGKAFAQVTYREYMLERRREYLEWLKAQTPSMSERARIAGLRRPDLYKLFERYGVPVRNEREAVHGSSINRALSEWKPPCVTAGHRE